MGLLHAIGTPILRHIFGAYFFANMGGGGGQNCFQRGVLTIANERKETRADAEKRAFQALRNGTQNADKRAQTLRLGWPATEWETGQEPKMAEKWPAKWPAAISRGGPKMAGKWPGKWPDSQNLVIFAIFPAIFRPFWGPLEKWLPAISLAIFQPFLVLGPFPHSVAGQPSHVLKRAQEFPEINWGLT